MVYIQSITSQVPYVVQEPSPNLYVSDNNIKNRYCVTDLPLECQTDGVETKTIYLDLQPLPALRKSPRLDVPIIDDQEVHKVPTVNRDLDELLEELMRPQPSDVTKAQRELDQLLEELTVHSEIDTEMNNFMVL